MTRPVRQVCRVRHNLHLPPTDLVGREGELATASRLLFGEGVRLLTLTGAPGSGKTRLALALAWSAVVGTVEDVRDGMWFVSLAPLTEPAGVLEAIAATLGVPVPGDRSLAEALVKATADRRLLLILDNCEHVLEGAAPLGDLLSRATGLRILATSRTPLRLRGERELPVSPLDLPTDNTLEVVSRSAAATLFLARARDVRPDFALTAGNAPAVAAICRRLDGLPLAIELAAARLKVLGPEALLEQLQSALPLLTGGARDLPQRQRTLRDAIAWSYDLLDGVQQGVFRSLGVCTGGISLPAAAAVAAISGGEPAALDVAGALLNASLLQPQLAPDGAVRFGMLEMVREFALERLDATGETEGARACHAAHFLTLAERAAGALHGPQQAEWLDALELEEHNLLAAMRWAIAAGDAPCAVRLGASLWWYAYVRGRLGVNEDVLANALALPDPRGATPPPARARAMIGGGMLAEYHSGTFTGRARARSVLQEAVALARRTGDVEAEALALIAEAMRFVHVGDYPPAHQRLLLATDIAQRIEHPFLLAYATNTLGHLASQQGQPDEALALLSHALELRQGIGDAWGTATSLNDLGHVHVFEGRLDEAQDAYQRSLAIRRRIGHRQGIALSLNGLGRVAEARKDFGTAARYFEQGFGQLDDVGHSGDAVPNLRQAYVFNVDAIARMASGPAASWGPVWGEAGAHVLAGLPLTRVVGLAGCAALALQRGDRHRAALLGGAAEVGLEAARAALPASLLTRVERNLRAVKIALHPQIPPAWREGRAMPPAGIIAVAREVLTTAQAPPPPAAPPAESAPLTPDQSPEADRPGGLTPRELEVAQLIAEGRTNRQIATALTIAPRTAMRHVEHIMTKLGVHSRTEVGVWVARQGLPAGGYDSAQT